MVILIQLLSENENLAIIAQEIAKFTGIPTTIKRVRRGNKTGVHKAILLPAVV